MQFTFNGKIQKHSRNRFSYNSRFNCGQMEAVRLKRRVKVKLSDHTARPHKREEPNRAHLDKSRFEQRI